MKALSSPVGAGRTGDLRLRRVLRRLDRRRLLALLDNEFKDPATAAWRQGCARASSPEETLKAVERVVDATLDRLQLLHDDLSPSRRLRVVADALGARIEEFRSGERIPSAQGWTTLSPEGFWRIAINASSPREFRFILAHELGHCMLFTSKKGPDRAAWRQRQWSPAEEALAYHLGRRILVPPTSLSRKMDASNPDANLFGRELPRHYGVDAEVIAQAATEVDDDGSRCPQAIIGWRQYGLLDFAYWRMAAKSIGSDATQVVLRSKDDLEVARRVLSHDEAQCFLFELSRSTWLHHVGRMFQQANPLAVTASFASRLSAHIEVFQALANALLDAPVHGRMRADWIYWSPQVTPRFIPIKDGRALPNSSVERACDGESERFVCSKQPAKVGRFDIGTSDSVFAAGDLRRGTRTALQVLV